MAASARVRSSPGSNTRRTPVRHEIQASRHALHPAPLTSCVRVATDTESTGTTPLQTIAGLGYSLSYLAALGGVPALAAHNARLYAHTHALLAREPRVATLSPPPGSGLESALLSFAITCNATNSDVAHALGSEHAIVVKTLPDGEGGTPLVRNALRVSHHAFNSIGQMERFALALRDVLGEKCL